MQTQRRRSVMAPLVLAVVVVFAWGIGAAVLSASPHAATTAKIEAKAAELPNTAALTALIHPSGGLVTTQGKGTIHSATSGNWAGYVDVANTAGTVTEVFSEWSVPTAICGSATPSGGAYEVQWIGIDGWTSGSVEQAGSLNYCSGPGATPAYYTWWEFYPYNDIQIVASSSAGAFISAYVLYNPAEEVNGVPGVYTLELFDVDHGVSFYAIGGGWDLGYTPADADAECISEAPSGFGYSGVTPLAHYTGLKFLACDTTIGSLTTGIGHQGSEATMYEVNQYNPGLDQKTGGLSNYYGTSSTFSITWKGFGV
ncbi:MAG: hypothetical protein WB947_01760 [Thermoplasmata archaeon]